MLAINYEYYFAYQKWQKKILADDFDEKQGLYQGKIKPITLDSICYY